MWNTSSRCNIWYALHQWLKVFYYKENIIASVETNTFIADVSRLVFACVSVALDSILQEVRSLEKGMEMARKEFMVQDDNPALKEFLKTNSELLDGLIKDSKAAQVHL